MEQSDKWVVCEIDAPTSVTLSHSSAAKTCEVCAHSIHCETGLLCLSRVQKMSNALDGVDRVKLNLGDCKRLNRNNDCRDFKAQHWWGQAPGYRRAPQLVDIVFIGFLLLAFIVLSNYVLLPLVEL